MMEKDIFDVIRDKEFSELTPFERNEVESMCHDEKEYNQLRSFLTQVNEIHDEQIIPEESSKEKLDDLFYAQFPKAVNTSYTGGESVVGKQALWYKSPLVRVAAVLALLLLAYPFFRNSIKQDESRQLAENKVVTKPDANKDTSLKMHEEIIMREQKAAATLLAESHLLKDEAAPTVASGESIDASFSPESRSMSAGAIFAHPDGIYDAVGSGDESTTIAADEMLSVLDLLTTTF